MSTHEQCREESLFYHRFPPPVTITIFLIPSEKKNFAGALPFFALLSSCPSLFADVEDFSAPSTFFDVAVSGLMKIRLALNFRHVRGDGKELRTQGTQDWSSGQAKETMHITKTFCICDTKKRLHRTTLVKKVSQNIMQNDPKTETQKAKLYYTQYFRPPTFDETKFYLKFVHRATSMFHQHRYLQHLGSRPRHSQ